MVGAIRKCTALTAVFALACLVGCRKADSDPVKALQAYLDAQRTGDIARAYHFLSSEQKKHITLDQYRDQEAKREAVLTSLQKKLVYKVTGAQIRGDEALATLTILTMIGPKTADAEAGWMQLHHEPEGWRIGAPPASATDEENRAALGRNMTEGVEKALGTLKSFFYALHTKSYMAAEKLYGGGYEALTHEFPTVTPSDHVALLQLACEQSSYRCLPMLNIKSGMPITATSFAFMVEFDDGSGKPAAVGPAHHQTTTFPYIVEKSADGDFKVTRLPPFEPRPS